MRTREALPSSTTFILHITDSFNPHGYPLKWVLLLSSSHPTDNKAWGNQVMDPRSHELIVFEYCLKKYNNFIRLNQHHLLAHNFWRSEVQVQCGWVLCSRSNKSEIKMPTRLGKKLFRVVYQDSANLEDCLNFCLPHTINKNLNSNSCHLVPQLCS